MGAKYKNNSLMVLMGYVMGALAVLVTLFFIFGSGNDIAPVNGITNNELPTVVEPVTTQADKDTLSEDVVELNARLDNLSREFMKKGGTGDSQPVTLPEDQLQAIIDKAVEDRLKGQQTVDTGTTTMHVGGSVDDELSGYVANNSKGSSDVDIFDNDGAGASLDGFVVGSQDVSGVSEKEEPIEWIEPIDTVPSEEGGLFSDIQNTGNAVIDFGVEGTAQEKPKPIQYATLDREAILFDALLINDMVGVVPKGNGIQSPFYFKVELSAENFATSGIHLPHLAKMRMSGYSVGEWSKSCVQGVVTSATFVFDDGTITSVGDTGNGSSGNQLGYVTNSFGDPCIEGEKISDLHEYAAISGGLSSLSSIGAAISAQQFDDVNTGAGIAQAFTGDTVENAVGAGLSGGLDTINQAVAARYANVRDLIVARSNQNVVIHLTQQIPIDYDPEGRKVFNEHFEEELGAYYDSVQ